MPYAVIYMNLLGLARSPPLYPGSDFPTREEATMPRKIINVVGAAIIKDGEVLCARRGEGKSLAGYWEFPGGKIELHESASLHR